MTRLPWKRRKRVLRFLLLFPTQLIHWNTKSLSLDKHEKSRQTFFSFHFIYFFPCKRDTCMKEQMKRKAKWKNLLISYFSSSFDARSRLSVFFFIFPFFPFQSASASHKRLLWTYSFSGELRLLLSCRFHMKLTSLTSFVTCK